MDYKCTNCKQPIDRKRGLCEDCKAAAAELDRRVHQKTEEEVLDELERKPRSWRDIFGKVTR